MAATTDQVAQLRRMIAEPTTTTYSDADLAGYIERYPVVDARGEQWYEWDTSTTPPTQEANDDWIPTYDLNAAATDVWNEKAAALAANYDFTADGGTYHRSQAHQQAMQMVRFYSARRKGGSAAVHVFPQPLPEHRTRRGWLGNAAEDDDR